MQTAPVTDSVPEVVIVPPVKPVLVATEVTVPELLVHPESLLNLLNFNSPKAFLL
jgi:hypothetical protein